MAKKNSRTTQWKNTSLVALVLEERLEYLKNREGLVLIESNDVI